MVRDSSIIVEYRYDSWGNVLSESLRQEDQFGRINPIRYRSYYYDIESCLYYLESRYYNPEVGAFISIDSVEYLDTETIGGLNLFIYCNNNPVMRFDRTGHFWETVFDIGSTIWSLVDLIKNPTWGNAGWLALDVVFLAIPFVPGVGKGMKAITKVDDIADATSFVSKYNNVYVIGQNMFERVAPLADEIGASIYKGFSHYDDVAKVSKHLANGIGYADNMLFIARQSLKGAKFIDIGMDVSRIGNKAYAFSRFTIYSERFVAEIFRLQKLLRLGQHICF